jgi:hypothetical protein
MRRSIQSCGQDDPTNFENDCDYANERCAQQDLGADIEMAEGFMPIH